ncbi:MAG: YciI family protein [Proteobacteria bacterium]|nr:YciI family protein [Pseudomonadota bacterium]MYJ95147.1 YciI family protein [Pseudomonadota bacterium]
MLYCILARDVPDSEPLRAKARKAHMERYRKLVEKGRLVTAGPLPNIDAPDSSPAGVAGSLTIAEFESLEDAREWAESDPFIESGAYESVEVHPFKQVLP